MKMNNIDLGLWLTPTLNVTKSISSRLIKCSTKVACKNFLITFLAMSSTAAVSEEVAEKQYLESFKVIEPEIVDRYKNLYKTLPTGDSYAASTGSIDFSVTDISLPGNSSLPVELMRWIPQQDLMTGGPGGWAWNIPLIQGFYPDEMWQGKSYLGIEFGTGGWRDGFNCTGTVSDSEYIHVDAVQFSHDVRHYTYWEGKLLHIPGVTSEKFLETTASQEDAHPFGPNKQVTKSNFVVTECIDAGDGEEGFVVQGPDGTLYTFDQIKSYPSNTPPSPSGSPVVKYTKLILVSRIEDRFGNWVSYEYSDEKLLKKISSSDGRKIDIAYKDVTVNASVLKLAESATANGATWEYKYLVDPIKVDLVNLPDGSSWTYSDAIYKLAYDPTFVHQFSPNPRIDGRFMVADCKGGNDDPLTIRVGSPSGLLTTYYFEHTYHGRSKVHPQTLPRYVSVGPPNSSAQTEFQARNLNCALSYSLVSKILTGNGFSGQSWGFEYSKNTGTYLTPADMGYPDGYENSHPLSVDLNDAFDGITTVSSNTGLPTVVAANPVDYRTTTVTGPDTRVVHYIDRRFQSPTEGIVIAEDHLTVNGTKLLKRVEYSFSQDTFVGEHWFIETDDVPWWFFPPTRDSLNANMLQYRVNPSQVKITQYYDDGSSDTYITNKGNYDKFGNVRHIEEYAQFDSSRQRHVRKSYLNDEGAWIIGIPTKIEIGDANNDNDYTATSEVIFHGTAEGSNSDYSELYLPFQFKSNGVVVEQYPEYHIQPDTSNSDTASPTAAYGRVKKIELLDRLKEADGSVDALSAYRYQLLENYKRGKPQTVSVPARYGSGSSQSFSRVVNDDGEITQITDLNGVTVSYGYNAIGRLQYMDLPANDQDWLDTYIDWNMDTGGFQPATTRTARSCRLSSGRTGCEAASGTFQSTSYLDALYRVSATVEEDLLNLDVDPRHQNFTYDSLHNATFSSFKDSFEDVTLGTNHIYDDLGRLQSSTISGGAVVTYSYLNNNRLRVTDAEGNITTTRYLAYGTPVYDQPLVIESPESVTTTLSVNHFGEIETITQTGPGKNGSGTLSQTEYRAYDSQHNLCKVSRQDVGTSAFGYNSIGQKIWQASGLAWSPNTNCLEVIDSSKTVNFRYDNLGQMWKADFTDDTPDQTYTHDPAGNLKVLNAGNVRQDYVYNELGLITKESLTLDNKIWQVGYTYDNAMNLSSITYPNGETTSYNPNGFGQATWAMRQAGSGVAAFTYAENARYYANGMLDEFDYGNGLQHKIALNIRQLPESVRAWRTGYTALNYAYTYDNNNNVKTLLDNVHSSYSLTDLQYDGLDRLTATIGNNGVGSSSLKYDGLGNITGYSSKNSVLDYVYTPTNRLETVTGTGSRSKNYSFGYDSQGNVISNGSRGFTFNKGN